MKIEGLTTQGSTALGPALVISAGIISAIPQSEVVLCTDGQPNVGIGKLSGNQDGTLYERVMSTHIDISPPFSLLVSS